MIINDSEIGFILAMLPILALMIWGIVLQYKEEKRKKQLGEMK